MLEYEGGAMGYLTASTAEAGTDKMLEIVGDRAVLKIAGDKVEVRRFERPLCDHVASADGPPIEQHESRVLSPAPRSYTRSATWVREITCRKPALTCCGTRACASTCS